MKPLDLRKVRFDPDNFATVVIDSNNQNPPQTEKQQAEELIGRFFDRAFQQVECVICRKAMESVYKWEKEYAFPVCSPSCDESYQRFQAITQPTPEPRRCDLCHQPVQQGRCGCGVW